MILGTPVSFGRRGLLSSVDECIRNEANAFMISTSIRHPHIRLKPLHHYHYYEAIPLFAEHAISFQHSYLLLSPNTNLASNDPSVLEKLRYAVSFATHIGIQNILIPSPFLSKTERSAGIKRISRYLNLLLSKEFPLQFIFLNGIDNGRNLITSPSSLLPILEGVHYTEKISYGLHTGFDLANGNDTFLSDLSAVSLCLLAPSSFEKGSNRFSSVNLGSLEDTVERDLYQQFFQSLSKQNIPTILLTPKGQRKEELAFLKGDLSVSLTKYSFTKTR